MANPVDASNCWMGNGVTASLINNDIAVYGGGESLWMLSLPTLQWNEVWTSGEVPPHNLRWHTATSLRLPTTDTSSASSSSNPNMDGNESGSNTSTTGTTTGCLVVLGGEPRYTADLTEAIGHGDKMQIHSLRIRARSWNIIKPTGDIPLNRCMHTSTKLRGTTLAVYGGRPIGDAGKTPDNSPNWDDSSSAVSELISRGFYDVYLVDVAVGVWRRISTNISTSGDILCQPCLWGHTAYATSVFPPRRSSSGEYRHRIDLVIHGGFDSSPKSNETAAKYGPRSYVLQPVAEDRPTQLKWGPANLVGDSNNKSASGGIVPPPEYALHTIATPDSVREGSHPAFFIGGIITDSTGEQQGGLIPSNRCCRIAVKANSWQEGARGQIIQLPPLEPLYATGTGCIRPLMMYYSDQLIVVESTERVWLLDLQEQQQQEWSSVDTALGPNEDIERWRIGCPVHPEYGLNNACDPDEINMPMNLADSFAACGTAATTGTDPDPTNTIASNKNKTLDERRREAAGSSVQTAQQGGENETEEERRSRKRREKQERREKRKKLATEKPPPPKSGDVRGEWKALMDEKRNRMYYVNTTTKKSTWKIEETIFNQPFPNDDFISSGDDGDEDDFLPNENNTSASRGAWGNSMSQPSSQQQQQQQNSSQSQQREGSHQQSMQTFLGNNNNQNTSTSAANTGNTNWWREAGEAKHQLRGQSESQQRYQQQHIDPTESISASAGNVPPPSHTPSDAMPPLAPPSAPPTPTPTPRIDLPIDFLIQDIDKEVQQEKSRAASLSAQQLLMQKQQQQQQTSMSNSYLNHLDSSSTEEEAAAKSKDVFQLPSHVVEKVIDPVEKIDYPFLIEEALLAPFKVVMNGRARRLQHLLEEEEKQAARVKAKEFDAKKFLKRNTHWETGSEYDRSEHRREERDRQRYYQKGEHNKHIVDMLPTMIASAKNNNNNTSNSRRGGGEKYDPEKDRPSALQAAEYSHTGSAAESMTSSRASTPVVAAPLFGDFVDPKDLSGGASNYSSRSNSRSHSVESIHGMRTHHVSHAIRDMMNTFDDDF